MFSLIIDLFTVWKSATAVVSALVTCQSAPSLNTGSGVEKNKSVSIAARQTLPAADAETISPRRRDPAPSLIKALLCGSAAASWRVEPRCSRGLDGIFSDRSPCSSSSSASKNTEWTRHEDKFCWTTHCPRKYCDKQYYCSYPSAGNALPVKSSEKCFLCALLK